MISASLIKTLEAACLAVFIIASLAGFYYSGTLHFTTPPEQSEHTAWLLTHIRDIALMLTIAISISGSIWLYEITENKTKAKRAIVLSVLAALCMIAYLAYAATRIEHVQHVFSSTSLKPSEQQALHKKLLQTGKFSQAEKQTQLNKLASLIYANSGDIIDVLDDSGALVRYSPSKQDKEIRKQNQQTIYQLAQLVHSLQRGMYLWIAVLIFSILFGLSAVALRKRSSN